MDEYNDYIQKLNDLHKCQQILIESQKNYMIATSEYLKNCHFKNEKKYKEYWKDIKTNAPKYN